VHISNEHPVYVFIRSAIDGNHKWKLIDPEVLQGDGFGMLTTAGEKKATWWGSGLTGDGIPALKVRGIPMARIAEGEFNMKSFPAGGKDPSKAERPNTDLPEFFMAINETTNDMYADFLSEMGRDGSWWHPRMANPKRGGISRADSGIYIDYMPIPGREHFPVIYVSWYDAHSFANWCGLDLPSEVMWEKAYVGGLFLDGDKSRRVPNPIPERKYPWGNETPDANGIFRCNIDGDADGFPNQAPVGSFSNFSSPYEINDLAGNVAEWTQDWYTTTYHAGLDGFRMVRGGSWMAMPLECDAVSGATQFPIKESSIMGFRVAKSK
jgi:formylglycine-generating enzyme required for sulfatase activity